MNLLHRLYKNLKTNAAEYYTLLTLVLAIPLTITLFTDFRWGLLASFVTQALIGIFYIKGSNQ